MSSDINKTIVLNTKVISNIQYIIIHLFNKKFKTVPEFSSSLVPMKI